MLDIKKAINSDIGDIFIYGAGLVGKILYNYLVNYAEVSTSRIHFVISGEVAQDIFGKKSICVKALKSKNENNNLVIIAVKPNSHPEMERTLIGLGVTNYYILSQEDYDEIYSSDIEFAMACENQLENKARIANIEKKLSIMEGFNIRHIKRAVLNFEIQLAEHCNLNCRGCDHFSPIADNEFIDEKLLEIWYQHLSEIVGDYIGYIKLLGGEPLLNPDIVHIADLTRKYFHQGSIEIVTNGVLLNKMDGTFWECCKRNDIHLLVTKYPINLDFDEMERTAKSNHVGIEFTPTEVIKTLWRLPLDLEGRQDPSTNFYYCWRANQCITLQDGKLFNCVVPAHIGHFNKKFDKNIPVTERDFLRVEDIHSFNELMEFLNAPKPFCRYCAVMKETTDNPWETSKKVIEEWT